MNYKKFIGSRNIRLKIISLFNWIPDSMMVFIQYLIYNNRIPNLKNPQRFTEKIQSYKLTCRIADMLRCTDKYEVRGFVKDNGLEDILIPLVGVYDSVDDIDFDDLPEQFVAKTTDGGGGNRVFICREKQLLSKDRFIETLRKWMSMRKPQKSAGREWAYLNGYPRRIIIEEMLDDGIHKDIPDYKFWCFNGVPRYCQVIGNRTERETIDFFDMEWNHQSFRGLLSKDKGDLYENSKETLKRPQTFERMLNVAGQLSKKFPFVRVDLYEAKGRTYFGELTFYPAGGYGEFEPDSYDFKLGSYLDLGQAD